MWFFRWRDVVRARVAVAEAVAVSASAHALFRAGGHRILPAGAREVVREIAEQSSTRFVSVAPKMMVGSVATAVAPTTTALAAGSGSIATTSGTLARAVAKAAGREVAKGVGRAAAVGFVFDGVVGGAEAYLAYRRGSITRRDAYVHTAAEALTGAVATGAGVALAASAIAITGGTGAPVAIAVAAAGSFGTKRILNRVFRKPLA